jgi:hypothetical protein
VSDVPGPSCSVPLRQAGCTWCTSFQARPCQRSTLELSLTEHSPVMGSRHLAVSRMLLRKEVIQPHLPVRLPCYDFVPIASPTFDSSLPYGLGHRLRVLPTFVT